MKNYYELYERASKAISFYGRRENVVQRINDGQIQGFEEVTKERLAAAYAINCLEGEPLIEDDLETHLHILEDDGAEFDVYDALEEAMKMVEAIKEEHT